MAQEANRGVLFHLQKPWELAEFDEFNGEALANKSSTAGQLKEVFLHVGNSLSKADLQKLRGVSRIWRFLVSEHPRYEGKAKGTLHTNWYSHVKAIEAAGGVPIWKLAPHWESLKLEHFKLYRHSAAIKAFWVETAANLTTLVVEKCTLECDGFRLLLDYSPSLKRLEMKNVNLRDFEDLHAQSEEPKNLLEGKVPIPSRKSQLTHLSFEGVNAAEGCFMEYLSKITGQLETLSVVECFQEDPARHYREKETNLPSWADVQGYFLEDVSNLVQRNRETLLKLDILSEVPQNAVWTRLAGLGFVPGHLGISFHRTTLEEVGESVRRLLGNENLLSLQFDIGQSVPMRNVCGALGLVNPLLQKLKVSFKGRGSFDGAEGLASLNISPVLQHLGSLEKLWIQDRKVLSKIEKRIIDRRLKLFPYRLHRGLGHDAARLRNVLTDTNSHFDITSLRNLTEKISDLRLDGIINHQDVFSDATLLPQVADSLKNLRRLEIRGPWLTPLSGILRSVFVNSRGLQTLILPACSVTDEDITGLCREAVNGIRKAMTYAFDLYTPNDFANRGDFAELVEDASAEWNEKRNMRRAVNPIRGRPKLSDLKDLVHLDLSCNPRISDVGIYAAMKLRNLKILGLHSCHRVTDSGLELLSSNCPDLEVLDIKNVRRVSAVGMSELIRKCRKLRRIYTTRIIQGRTFEGFLFQMNQNFNDIVMGSVLTDMEDMLGKVDVNGELLEDDSESEDEDGGDGGEGGDGGGGGGGGDAPQEGEAMEEDVEMEQGEVEEQVVMEL